VCENEPLLTHGSEIVGSAVVYAGGDIKGYIRLILLKDGRVVWRRDVEGDRIEAEELAAKENHG
jgi:PQQ enzyme repeat